MFITPAFAQAVDAAPGGSALLQFLPFVIIIAIMYFLIIRPQQNRMKEHRAMIAAVRRGDTVVTAGGVIGKVVKVLSDTEMQVEIAEGVRVRLVKGTITDVRSKTEPVRESARRNRDEEEDETDADDAIDEMDDGTDDDMDDQLRKPAKSEPLRASNQPASRPAPSRSLSQRRGKAGAVIAKKPVRPGVGAPASGSVATPEKPSSRPADDRDDEKDI